MIRDKEHLAFIRTLPCLKCWSYETQASHIRRHSGGGTAYKSGDDNTLPLCHAHHYESHRIGEEAFFGDIYKAKELAHALYAETGDAKKALGLIVRFKKCLFGGRK